MRGTGVLCGEVFLYYAGISAVEFPLSVCLFSHAFETEYLQQRFQNVLAHFTFQRADCHFREKGEEGTYHCGGEVMFLCKPANLLKGCDDIPLHCVGTTFLFLLIVVRVFKVLKVIRVLIVLIVIIVIIVINDLNDLNARLYYKIDSTEAVSIS